MGRRSAGETLARILLAFMRQPVWSQANLARHCEVDVRALRARLLELCEAGFPLVSEPDHPHVYWSVPSGWFPGGRVLSELDAKLVARLLARLPDTSHRRRALQALQPRERVPLALAKVRESAEAVLETLEDGLRERQAVELEYYSASRGIESRRSISIHRIFHAPHVRVLATCHISGGLRYFRADRTRAAKLRPQEAFRAASEADIEEALQTSVDWFRTSSESVSCCFTVRLPEARWVTSNLPAAPFTEEHVEGGVRFEVRTAGIEALARFVVGLGSAARAETPELERAVTEIARGALKKVTPERSSADRSRSKRSAR